MAKKKISILTCAYNEKDNIENLYIRVKNTMKKLPQYDWELIYADNNSIDSSELIYRKLAKKDKHIKVIFMSRNDGSGQHNFLAGLHLATGDALVYLDADLQDPPEIIPEFVKKWNEGYDVAYGLRKKRKESLPKKIGFHLFYRLFQKIAYIDVPVDVGDFSLIDKKVINALKAFPEQDIFFRGIRAMAGFKQIGIPYNRDKRVAGKTTNSFFHLFVWAKRAIFNFSYKPLEMISSLAAFVTIVSLLYLIYFLYVTIFHRTAPQGFPTLVVLILLLSSVQLFSLSIIGDYLGRVFRETKRRPRAIVREILNDPNHKDIIIS